MHGYDEDLIKDAAQQLGDLLISNTTQRMESLATRFLIRHQNGAPFTMRVTIEPVTPINEKIKDDDDGQ